MKISTVKTDSVLFVVACILSVLVVLGCSVTLSQSSHLRWPYIITIILVLCAWMFRQMPFVSQKTMAATRHQKNLTQAIIYACIILIVSLILRSPWVTNLDLDFGNRILGCLMGLMVCIFANRVPKQISSGFRLRILRTVGWTLALGGLGYASAWLILPLNYANAIALLLLIVCSVVAILRIIYLRFSHRAAAP
ncbi:hypothetical protein [Undibacterium sp. Di24W]|uniref:hypothetical protein n=1 Tax=Undibacterium sp. Di24W TaxID=3413033 RepID=UPI003BF43B8E